MKTRRATFELTDLQPHPLSISIYGEPSPPAELVRSIKELGLISPLVIWKNFILSGNNRWAAMKKLAEYFPEEPAVVMVNEFEGTELEAEQLVIESNRQRVKTEAQKDAEAAALLRIETELAKERQRAGGGSGVSGRQTFAEPRRAVDAVAAVTGE